MADKRSRTENMRLLHDTLIYTLNEKERRQFTIILGDFQARRNRENFVISLRRLLSTSKKQEVVPYLIGILPNREREHFLDLWMRTSVYNSFYNSDQNRNLRSSSRLSGQLGNSASFNNWYAMRQQDRYGRKRQLQQMPQTYSKVKRNSATFRPLSNLSKNRLSASLPSLRSASQLDKQVKTHQITLKRDSKSNGFGFSIRGGAEHGLGIFVSSVDDGSVADRKNLSVGDQIIKVNECNFQNIEITTAIKVIQQNKKLRMLVYSSSMVPGSRVAHIEYQWVDTNGRPSSPPVNFRRSESGMGRSRSIGDIRLLQDDDERRVIVHVQNGARLGLRIRGGVEYGIGIFVSSVDRNQVAERSGIRAGDQIVDVNGVDFQEIAHKDAVRILKAYKMMSMLLRHIGKIPHARTVFEKTEWLDSARTSRSSSVISIAQDGRSSPSPEKSKFRQGIAGSQLLHQSTVVVPAHRRIEEQARSLLNERELASLKYYISQYIQGEIHVEGLVISLFHLFDSSTKISLLNDIRTVIFPQEVDTFDRLVLEKEIEAMKNLSRGSSGNGNGNHLKVNSESKSPKVPAKALSYKQLRSPKQEFQVTSKVPWSPPTSIPSIPSSEQVLNKEEIQIHNRAPEIDDLDFEDEEEQNYDDDDGDVIRNLEDDFDMEMFQRNDAPQNSIFNEISDDECPYEEIQHPMRAPKNESSNGSKSTNRRFASNDTQNDWSDGPVDASKDSDHPKKTNNANENGAHNASNDKDSDDIGISLMRSALLGFGGTNSKKVGFEEEPVTADVEEEVFAETPPENEHGTVSDDIMALYAIPDKSEKRSDKSSSKLSIYRPRVIPGEKVMEIPESVVSPTSSRSGDNVNGDVTDQSQKVFQRVDEDVIVAKDLETLLSASPGNGSTYLENVDSDKQAYRVNDSPAKLSKDIIDLSGFVKGIQIGDSNDEGPSIKGNGDEAMTLEELQNIGEDLEFEFEDEPEIGETMFEDKDDDLLSLKFAPIKVQETAPSSPSVNQNLENQNFPKINEEKYEPSHANKARAVNVYESESSMPRSFGFPDLSGNNRRQMFNVQDISNQDFGGMGGLHSFSPRILNSIGVNKGSERMGNSLDSGRNESPSHRLKNNQANKSDELQPVRSEKDTAIDRSAPEEIVIAFPDRSLTSKRIQIISYRADSPVKKHHDDHDIIVKNSQDASNSHEDEEKDGRFAFRNLRSIFETQEPRTPRTEYLSEIIKKNNTEGRKRLKSWESIDENANEYTASKASCTRQEMSIDNGRISNGNSKRENHASVAESDLSSVDDFDFSSIISKQTLRPSFNSQISDDKVEISSGYGSEDYSPVNENHQKIVRIEKNRVELGIILEASKTQRRGVQIKEIKVGELYAACQYPQLQIGQEVASIDGESLQGLGVKIATISINRAYNNPSGRFLELAVKNLQLSDSR